MAASKDLTDVLEELCYPKPNAMKIDQLSLVEFSQIAHWISKQMKFFAKTDSIVHVIKDDTDLVSLNIELNSLFNEVDSIYSDSFSLQTINDRLEVLHSLSGDLIAARLNYIKNESENDGSTELNPRKDLNTINICLAISDDLKDTKSYFQKVKHKLNSNLKLYEEDSLLLPDKKVLTSEQWTELKQLNETFRKGYSVRREMLLRRLDTTVNSFTWKNSDSSREIDVQLLKTVYKKCRDQLTITPGITLSHALAARSSDCNSLINDVISTKHANCVIDIPNIAGKANQGVQQRLQLHKYLIGSVPDRGGRPHEQVIPIKETFTQQKSQRENANNRRGRGRGGGGSEHRDNFNHNSNHRSGNYQPRQIPEQTSRVQNAGWQYDTDGYYGNGQQHDNYNNQGGRGQYNNQQWSQQDYGQYQGSYQRFDSYGQNTAQEPYYHSQNTRGRGRGGRGRGNQYRNNRY